MSLGVELGALRMSVCSCQGTPVSSFRDCVWCLARFGHSDLALSLHPISPMPRLHKVRRAFFLPEPHLGKRKSLPSQAL